MGLVRQKIRETKFAPLRGGAYVWVSLGAVAGPEALEGMRQTLQERVPSLGGNPWLFVGLLFIATVSAGIIVQRKMSEAEKAHRDLREKGFESDEVKVLDDLAQHHARLSAPELVQDEAGFDAAAEKYLEEIEDEEKLTEVGTNILQVRKKIDCEKKPDFRHYGTFGLSTGETLDAVLQRGESNRSFRLRVLGSPRSDLCVGGGEFPTIAAEGDSVDFYILGDGSRLRARTRVVDVDSDKEACHLEHSIEWENADRRRSHRVTVQGPVTLRTEDGEVEGWLSDLSAHGAGVVRVDGVAEGDAVTAVLSPQDYLAPVSAENHPDTIEVPGTVLKSRRKDSNKLYPVEFDEIPETKRQPLFHLVQDIEVRQRRS